MLLKQEMSFRKKATHHTPKIYWEVGEDLDDQEIRPYVVKVIDKEPKMIGEFVMNFDKESNQDSKMIVDQGNKKSKKG